MNLADVFTVTFLVLGLVVLFVCYWLLAAGLYPQFVERAAERFVRMPLRLVGLGLVTMGPLVLVGGWLLSNGPSAGLKILGGAIFFLTILAALLGSAGLAQQIGLGLRSARDEADPWRRVLRGGIVLGFTFVLPFIGTFVVLPLTLFAGFGAFLLARKRVAALPVTP